MVISKVIYIYTIPQDDIANITALRFHNFRFEYRVRGWNVLPLVITFSACRMKF